MRKNYWIWKIFCIDSYLRAPLRALCQCLVSYEYTILSCVKHTLNSSCLDFIFLVTQETHTGTTKALSFIEQQKWFLSKLLTSTAMRLFVMWWKKVKRSVRKAKRWNQLGNCWRRFKFSLMDMWSKTLTFETFFIVSPMSSETHACTIPLSAISNLSIVLSGIPWCSLEPPIMFGVPWMKRRQAFNGFSLPSSALGVLPSWRIGRWEEKTFVAFWVPYHGHWQRVEKFGMVFVLIEPPILPCELDAYASTWTRSRVTWMFLVSTRLFHDEYSIEVQSRDT